MEATFDVDGLPKAAIADWMAVNCSVLREAGGGVANGVVWRALLVGWTLGCVALEASVSCSSRCRLTKTSVVEVGLLGPADFTLTVFCCCNTFFVYSFSSRIGLI